MDADRWVRAQELFHAALDRPEAERAAFLEREAENPALVAEVRAMLAEDAGDGVHPSPLDRDLGDFAHGVLDGSAPLLRAVGPYRVRGVLGQGGSGVVYLAAHDELGRDVAIKVLRDAALSPARRARFEQEEQTLAALSHPAIARLYDADTLNDGTPYFVMEYVEGIPVTDYCDAHRLALRPRLKLFRTIAEAVRHAHQNLVVHRDLKPSNILVAEDADGRPMVKLLDFGIAKPLDVLGKGAQTRTGLRLMTPAYAAPEQFRGEAVGTYTDVYALGVLLYELLTGCLPFDLAGQTPGQVEAQILSREPEPPSVRACDGGLPDALNAGGWADLDVLCLTAMHKDSTRRYATTDALLRDLDHFLDGKPLDARPDAWSYRAGKFVRRHREPLAAAAAVLALLIGLTAFFTARLAEQRNRAEAEAAKAERVADYLVGLFEASDPFGAGADSLSIETLLTQGTARAEALDEQPIVQAQMLDALGRVHTQLSRFERADTLLRRALALRRAQDIPLDVAETLTNLGVLYYQRGEHEPAEESFREAITLRETHLPPNHPALATTLTELGVVLTDVGRYEEAETLYRLALRIQRNAHEGPNQELGRTLTNLGVNFLNQGLHDEAEPYFRQALANDRALFGPNHPFIAVKLSYLASVYEGRQEYVRADSMMTETLRIRRATLGDDHFYTIYGITQLANLARKMKDYGRAEAYFRESLAAHERILGPEHINTNVARNFLAVTLNDQGRYHESEPIFRRTVPIFYETLGEEHYYSASSRCQLAEALHQNGEIGEAEAQFRACLPALRNTFPPDHPSVVIHESNFGAFLTERGAYNEAEPLLLHSYESFTASRGPDHEYTRTAARRLTELYEAWGKPDEAAWIRAEQARAAAESTTE